MLFVAYEVRRKFFRNAIREPAKQGKDLRENSPKRQSILNAANDLRVGGSYSIRTMTAFFERLVYSDNERDPMAYSILLDLYNQRIPSGDGGDEKYIDFDTQTDIHRLWEQIRRNSSSFHIEEAFIHRSLPSVFSNAHFAGFGRVLSWTAFNYPNHSALPSRSSTNRPREKSRLYALQRAFPSCRIIMKSVSSS